MMFTSASTMPARVLPMLATRSEPFDDEHCLFEIKHDGVRAMSSIQNGRLRVWGREGVDYTDRYPELQSAAASSLPRIVASAW